MLDIADWMESCNKQINMFRKSQYSAFWHKLMHQEFITNNDEHGTDTSDGKESQEDLIKFKTQLGVINKHKVTVLLARDLKEADLLDVN